jgi:preprotein translocase subunit SecF
MKLLKLVPDNTNIDFMKWRNFALILSIIATVASLVLVGVRGLNLGIDFVGGQVVRATFAQPVDIEDLRGKVDSLNVGEASIQEFGDNKTYQIRLPKPEGPDSAANQVVTEVRAMVEKQYPGVQITAGASVSG